MSSPKPTAQPSNPKPQSESNQPYLQQTKPRPQQKRDTHFICFPLVTPTSTPQLAKSLARFREITTLTPEVVQRRKWKGYQQPGQGDIASEREDGAEGGPEIRSDINATPRPLNGKTEAGTTSTFDEDNLSIIPPVAHRPPGTFHLTIGTMDLNEKSEMERAIGLLKELDLQSMMGDVDRELGSKDSNVKRKGSGSRNKSENESRSDSRSKSELGAEHILEGSASTAENVKTGNSIKSLSRPISPPPIVISDTPLSSNINPITISLAGLSTFPSPRHARVFYAPPLDPSDRLLPLAQKIRAAFKAEGFISEARELTLHATVANLRYATQNRRGGARGAKGSSIRARGVVDAREIIKEFGVGGRYAKEKVRDQEREEEEEEEERRDGQESKDGEERCFIWAENILVDRVRICKMGAEKSDDPVLGMVYPAVVVDGAIAEVRIS